MKNKKRSDDYKEHGLFPFNIKGFFDLELESGGNS